jgi:hypothetical protein
LAPGKTRPLQEADGIFTCPKKLLQKDIFKKCCAFSMMFITCHNNWLVYKCWGANPMFWYKIEAEKQRNIKAEKQGKAEQQSY